MLLDSANLCAPTVLDRLNPLLEPQGGWVGGFTALHCSALVGLHAGSGVLAGPPGALAHALNPAPTPQPPNPTTCTHTSPGVLLLNECGGGGAAARVVRPHPAFRLFLALDPR